MADDWNIKLFLSKLTDRYIDKEQLKKDLTESMEHEMMHDLAFKKRKRVTRFIRSTEKSEAIGQNYMIMRSLQIAAENGDQNYINGYLIFLL